jgi:hypothetical protein
LGKGWQDPCGEFRGFFSGFGNDGVAAKCEANQCGTFVVGVGETFHQALLLETVDQDLNVLTGAESRASDLGNGLRTVALEELKRSATGAWEG